MNNIQRNIIFIGIFSAVGCATAPSGRNAASLTALPAVTASYDERVGSVSVEQFKGASCPQDGKWEGLEWKKITPLANACVKAKDWNKVEAMGNHLSTRAHLTPWGAYYMGLAAEGRKDYPRAIWMFELALKKAPKEGLFHYELARIHWELGADQEAVKHMKQASDLNPTLTQAHFTVGQFAMLRRDYSEAEGAFAKALKNDSKYLPALLGMSTLLINKKDYVRAEGYLAQALGVNPKSAKVRLALAQVQEEHLKKYEEALHGYKQLRSLSADKKLDEPVRLNLDEKIKSLEKNMAQAAKDQKLTVRTPSGERKVE